MYSYDLATPSRPSTTSRSIPSMRPSYDAEHPSSATPIYDSLYSEYRRLFRALPGDRSGEENLRFTGFAVRDHPRPEALPYPQHQAFHTYPGHAQGTPQYMPSQQSAGTGQYSTGHYNSTGQGWVATAYLAPTQPVGGSAADEPTGGGQGTVGRHRSMLSLPPGR